MASPLTFYIQLQQNERAQEIAENLSNTFAEIAGPVFTAAGVVHYARVALVPNPRTSLDDNPTGWLGLQLITSFDGGMTAYLTNFWDNAQFKALIVKLGSVAYPPQPILSLTQFENFFNDNNLTPAPDLDYTNYVEAYGQTVEQILEAFPQ